MDSKLYAYEIVMSKDEYKALVGRRIMLDSEWIRVREELTNQLEQTLDKFIEEKRSK